MLEQAEEDAWNEHLATYSDDEQEEISEFGATLQELWDRAEAKDARDQARQRTIGAIAQAARDHSDATSPLNLVSVVTGRPGESGGLNTASDIVLRGLGLADSITPFALLATGTAPPLARTDEDVFGVEFLALGSKRQLEVMQSKIPTWVFGHGVVTGRIAKMLAEDWGLRRVHFVHVDPFQIEMARGTGLNGSSNALYKFRAELELLRSADVKIFIGNSAQAYPQWSGDPRSLTSFALGATAAANVSTPGREPIQVMMFGRLDDPEVKGVDVLDSLVCDDDLLRWRSSDGSRIEFMAIGMGEEDERTSKWAGRCAVHPELSRPEIHELFLPQASVVIHPSNADSFGLSALEALTLGRPTLVSESAGIAMLYKEFERSDWVLPARLESEPKEWSNQIKNVTDTPESWLVASQQAVELAKRITERSSEDVERLLHLLQAPSQSSAMTGSDGVGPTRAGEDRGGL